LAPTIEAALGAERNGSKILAAPVGITALQFAFDPTSRKFAAPKAPASGFLNTARPGRTENTCVDITASSAGAIRHRTF